MKTCITTGRLPLPVGAYAQIVVSNGFLFLSGQIPVDRETGRLIEGGIREQTEAVLGAIKSVMEERYLGLKDVVKVTAYLVSPQDFDTFNVVYAEYFDTEPPARTTVFVSALPKHAKVELDVVAALDTGNA